MVDQAHLQVWSRTEDINESLQAELLRMLLLAGQSPKTKGIQWPKCTLGRSGPIGPWAVQAQLVPGLFGPNWTLDRSGPIGPWAVEAQLVPGPFGPNWSLGRSGP